VRSWYPIPAKDLDNKRLLGEHNEILIMARSIAGIGKGWRNHPETKRWVGHSKFLAKRHDELAAEMQARGMNHKSPWPQELINEADTEDPPGLWEPLEVMKEKLHNKMNGVKDATEQV
jgi:hypothetical protein